MALRWGIASAGRISHDFATAVSTLPSTDHKVVAIAATDLKRAKDFAALHGIENAYQSYEDLGKDKNVDIVYIGSYNTQHYPIAKQMLEYGKHVLCEKPLCVNSKQTKSLTDLAKSKKLFLMEAIWSRFFPAYIELKKQIESGALGDIHHVRAEMGVKIADVERIKKNELGGGTILDLGIYVLQFSQLIFKSEPTEIIASGNLNENGVDTSMSCILRYPNGGTAVVSTNSKIFLSNEAVVTGTKGSAKLSPLLWCPTQITLPDGSIKTYTLPKAKIDFVFDNSAGLSFEAEECRRCIKNGLIESPSITHENSVQLSRLQDTIRKQLGVKFSEDDLCYK